MAQFLELRHLAQEHAVAQVQVGGGGIEPALTQGFSAFQLGEEELLGVARHRAFEERARASEDEAFAMWSLGSNNRFLVHMEVGEFIVFQLHHQHGPGGGAHADGGHLPAVHVPGPDGQGPGPLPATICANPGRFSGISPSRARHAAEAFTNSSSVA